MSSSKPGEKAFNDLISALRKPLKSTPSEIVERCKFHCRVCRPGYFKFGVELPVRILLFLVQPSRRRFKIN